MPWPDRGRCDLAHLKNAGPPTVPAAPRGNLWGMRNAIPCLLLLCSAAAPAAAQGMGRIYVSFVTEAPAPLVQRPAGFTASPPPAEGTVTVPDGVDQRPSFSLKLETSGRQVGTLLGSGLGVALASGLFAGHDMGCDDIECYGYVTNAESRVFGAVVGGGVGYLVGAALDAAGWSGSTPPLGGIRFKISPKGKPGLKLKAVVAF